MKQVDCSAIAHGKRDFFISIRGINNCRSRSSFDNKFSLFTKKTSRHISISIVLRAFFNLYDFLYNFQVIPSIVLMSNDEVNNVFLIKKLELNSRVI